MQKINKIQILLSDEFMAKSNISCNTGLSFKTQMLCLETQNHSRSVHNYKNFVN